MIHTNHMHQHEWAERTGQGEAGKAAHRILSAIVADDLQR